MKTLKPNQKRAMIAIILKWFSLILETISLIYLLFSILFVDILITNDTLFSFFIDISTPLIITVITINILSLIAMILWFKRAYYNLHQKVTNLSYGVGWAVGCWFVPILNFIRPYEIMKELYVETDKLLKKDESNIDSRLNTKLLIFWWCFFVISVILNIIFYYNDDDFVIVLLSILGIITSWLTIKVIKTYSIIEPELANDESN